ncbi:MAG: hypothetical protein LAO21_11480 [Acidobacteriia bacterium]|nr:hypothetical protein [Terriglobia bacterium]
MKLEKPFAEKRACILVINLLFIVFLISCSGTSNQPNPATPEGRFELAKQNFSIAKYDKALEYTAKILRDTPNHELAGSAALMQMTIYGGLAEGCRQLGKTYADGRMMTRDVRIKNDFRNTAFDYYRRQKAYILNFVEGFDAYSKKMDKTKPVSYQGVYPQIEAGPRIFLEKVKKGLPIAEEDRSKDEEEELKNGVLTVLTQLAGVADDRAKAKTLFAAGPISVDTGEFLLAIAKILHEQDVLFDRLQLNELTNFRMFCDRTNTTVTESLDLLKAKGDKKKIDAAAQLKKDCDAMMKQFKKK